MFETLENDWTCDSKEKGSCKMACSELCKCSIYLCVNILTMNFLYKGKIIIMID